MTGDGIRRAPNPGPFAGERVTGIEPALSAWEADVLPLNYTRMVGPHQANTTQVSMPDHT